MQTIRSDLTPIVRRNFSNWVIRIGGDDSVQADVTRVGYMRSVADQSAIESRRECAGGCWLEAVDVRSMNVIKSL